MPLVFFDSSKVDYAVAWVMSGNQAWDGASQFGIISYSDTPNFRRKPFSSTYAGFRMDWSLPADKHIPWPYKLYVLDASISLGVTADSPQTGVLNVNKSLALGSIGDLTDAESMTLAGIMGLGVTPNITESNQATMANSVPLQARPNLVPSDSLTMIGLLSLGTIAALTGDRSVTYDQAVALVLSGGLTDSMRLTMRETLSLSELVSLTDSARISMSEQVGLTATGQITDAGRTTMQEAASFQVTANLSPIGRKVIAEAITLSELSDLLLQVVVGRTHDVSVSLGFQGQLVASVMRVLAEQVALQTQMTLADAMRLVINRSISLAVRELLSSTNVATIREIIGLSERAGLLPAGQLMTTLSQALSVLVNVLPIGFTGHVYDNTVAKAAQAQIAEAMQMFIRSVTGLEVLQNIQLSQRASVENSLMLATQALVTELGSTVMVQPALGLTALVGDRETGQRVINEAIALLLQGVFELAVNYDPVPVPGTELINKAIKRVLVDEARWRKPDKARKRITEDEA